MNKDRYIQIRDAIQIDEISYGYRTFTLFSHGELDEEQKGYRAHAVTSEMIKEWNDNWLVIGREELIGDPLFVDLQEGGTAGLHRRSRRGRVDSEPGGSLV